MKLKVVSYNLHHGLLLNQIVGNIQKLSAEGVAIFCLQELFELEGQPSVLGALMDALGDEWKYETFLEPGNYNFGLCLLWKREALQISKIGKLELPRLSKFNFYELFFEKVIIRWVNNPVKRGAMIATFNIGGRTLRITNVHLDPHGHFKQRGKQLRYLTSYLESLPAAEWEIICGDFNTIGIEAFTKNQEKKIHALLGTDFLNVYPFSTPTSNFFQRLDYIFVKNIKVVKAEVLKLKGSDHFPLVVDVAI